MKSLITCICLGIGLTAFGQEKSQLNQAESVETAAAQNSKDPYLGKQEKIKAMMLNGEIPASYPTYEEGLSLEDYRRLVYFWAKDNESLFKPEAYDRIRPKIEKYAK